VTTKNDLRSLTVGGKKNFRKKVVEIDEAKFEVRQLSVGDRQKIYDKSSKGDKISSSDFLVWSVIYCTFVPGTEEKVFDDADYESLMAQPSDSFVDKLGQAAGELLDTEGN